jgi:HEAT repeat protein
LKAKREKCQVTDKDEYIRRTADFSMEKLKSRRLQSDILQALKEITANLGYCIHRKSFKIKGEIKNS